jgi:hypothetical protein
MQRIRPPMLLCVAVVAMRAVASDTNPPPTARTASHEGPPPSPTLGAKPPPDAIVLFDGRILDQWTRQKPREWEESDGPATHWKLLPDGALEVVPGSGSIITKRRFGDCRLHVEFRTLGPVNSGVYLQSRYEISLKESFRADTNGPPCGAPGNFSGSNGVKPVVPNVARPPFEWQTLDIEFRAPRFDAAGRQKIGNARVTVALNGITLYRDFEIASVKGAAKRLGEAPTAPLMLQEHGTPIQFRNIWLVEGAP